MVLFRQAICAGLILNSTNKLIILCRLDPNYFLQFLARSSFIANSSAPSVYQRTLMPAERDYNFIHSHCKINYTYNKPNDHSKFLIHNPLDIHAYQLQNIPKIMNYTDHIYTMQFHIKRKTIQQREDKLYIHITPIYQINSTQT